MHGDVGERVLDPGGRITVIATVIAAGGGVVSVADRVNRVVEVVAPGVARDRHGEILLASAAAGGALDRTVNRAWRTCRESVGIPGRAFEITADGVEAVPQACGAAAIRDGAEDALEQRAPVAARGRVVHLQDGDVDGGAGAVVDRGVGHAVAAVRHELADGGLHGEVALAVVTEPVGEVLDFLGVGAAIGVGHAVGAGAVLGELRLVGQFYLDFGFAVIYRRYAAAAAIPLVIHRRVERDACGCQRASAAILRGIGNVARQVGVAVVGRARTIRIVRSARGGNGGKGVAVYIRALPRRIGYARIVIKLVVVLVPGPPRAQIRHRLFRRHDAVAVQIRGRWIAAGVGVGVGVAVVIRPGAACDRHDAAVLGRHHAIVHARRIVADEDDVGFGRVAQKQRRSGEGDGDGDARGQHQQPQDECITDFLPHTGRECQLHNPGDLFKGAANNCFGVGFHVSSSRLERSKIPGVGGLQHHHGGIGAARAAGRDAHHRGALALVARGQHQAAAGLRFFSHVLDDVLGLAVDLPKVGPAAAACAGSARVSHNVAAPDVFVPVVHAIGVTADAAIGEIQTAAVVRKHRFANLRVNPVFPDGQGGFSSLERQVSVLDVARHLFLKGGGIQRRDADDGQQQQEHQRQHESDAALTWRKGRGEWPVHGDFSEMVTQLDDRIEGAAPFVVIEGPDAVAGDVVGPGICDLFHGARGGDQYPHPNRGDPAPVGYHRGAAAVDIGHIVAGGIRILAIREFHSFHALR